MGPEQIVRAAGGLRIAQRDSGASMFDRDLGVADVGPVPLPDSPPLEGRRLDGTLWRRLWSLPDRLVLEFVDVVAVQVHDRDGSVTFDRSLASDVEQHLLLDHVLPLALARRGELVLHGAVLSIHDRAALLVGPSGAGKSTLTAYAGQRGWTVGGDDGAVLQVARSVTVEPTYPTVRLTPEATDLLGISREESTDVAGKRRLSRAGPKPFRADPSPVAVIAFVDPVPADQPAELTRVHGANAHAALFGVTFHAEMGDGPMLRDVFIRLGLVVEAVAVGRLAVPRGRAGLAAAEEVLRKETLGRPRNDS